MKLLHPAAALFISTAAAAETILGVYVFHRHGDRTAKSHPPVTLTALGADQVFRSGAFYRTRYVKQQSSSASSSSSVIPALAPNDGAVVPGQVLVTSPSDAVLHNSATTFLQGLYPPLGPAGNQTLADGTVVQAPLDGYQYVPVESVADAATAPKAESDAWLQGNSGCAAAELSSKRYLASPAFAATAADSAPFYRRLLPVIGAAFAPVDAAFKNAYAIFDYVNVATVHNRSVPAAELVSDAFPRLFALASEHEWNLAFNESEPVRAIAGSVLAGQVLDALDALVRAHTTATTAKKTAPPPAFNAQFGAYGTFMSFFGLAALPDVSADFYGICNYASSMTFELVANTTTTTDAKSYYDEKDLFVRFFFANGTASPDSLRPYPLFGRRETVLAWPAFRDAMGEFAIKDTAHWCDVCGSNSGKCASVNSNAKSSSDGNGNGNGADDGISLPVAGVIGALVTLVVVLGAQAAIVLLGGFRLMKKSSAAVGRVGRLLVESKA